MKYGAYKVVVLTEPGIGKCSIVSFIIIFKFPVNTGSNSLRC